MNLSEYLSLPPYSLDAIEKNNFLLRFINDLSCLHYANCNEYKLLLDATGKNLIADDINNVPFIPTRLFKLFDLKSIPETDLFKTMTSSGTSGNVSKIYLDHLTANLQSKTLARIITSFIGQKRLPLIILDTSAVLKDRNLFSARGAGILGFSLFSSKKIFALDENMIIDVESIKRFIEENKNQTILIFGFTFMIWQFFISELKKLDINFDLKNAILIHGGGFKKLADQKISVDFFKSELNRLIHINKNHIHDYYGMVEQTGAIYVECEHGFLHTSIYSDIIIRNPVDFTPCPIGKRGIVQVISILPHSYPGHSLLTEDEGVLHGEDNCLCGRKGKYFNILGRLKSAEIRGCSDTYAQQ